MSVFGHSCAKLLGWGATLYANSHISHAFIDSILAFNVFAAYQEEIVQIEYIEAMVPPETSTSAQHDDWVSSVTCHPTAGLVLSGSFDKQGSEALGLQMELGGVMRY